jgi:hypothetical protein
MCDQQLGGFELADDLLGCPPGAFHAGHLAQSGRMRTLIHPAPVSGSTSISFLYLVAAMACCYACSNDSQKFSFPMEGVINEH